jgi:thiol-disulfide isomerase/thioredoxin
MKAIKMIKHLMPLFASVTMVLSGVMNTQADDKQTAATKPRCAVIAGQKAPAFQAQALSGRTIKFPKDYKGKVVLLDFWATWCRPCREELPNVVAAYQKYHPSGFEIVSVSLDLPRKGPDLLQFLKEHGMTWPQVYDGAAAKTPVAVEYGVHGIPCPVLVDGDTGTVLAVGAEALGHRLTRVLETALATKIKK